MEGKSQSIGSHDCRVFGGNRGLCVGWTNCPRLNAKDTFNRGYPKMLHQGEGRRQSVALSEVDHSAMTIHSEWRRFE